MVKKKQTVRVTFSYKVAGNPEGSGRPTTATKEKFFIRPALRSLTAIYDDVSAIKVEQVEVVA